MDDGGASTRGTAAAGDVRAVLREFTAGLRRTGGAGGDAKATIS